MVKLRIGLDIDDTLGGFFDKYKEVFNTSENPKMLKDHIITKNVYKLRKDKEFWLGLPKIDTIDFVPELYCTKRINPKSWSRKWLVDNGFPDRPIYQMVCQQGNKADMIKGRCDVLIDDSVSNVLKCLESGMPALLIDRPHNEWFGPTYRVYSLNYEEILDAYTLLLEYNGEKFF